MNEFQTGELVDVALRGARVVENGAKHLRLSVGGNDLYLATVSLPSVRITRVAPAEWPPQSGDVWEDADGTQFFGRDGSEETWLTPVVRGGNAARPGTVLEEYGPMRLAYRRGWTPEPERAADEPEQLDKRAEVIAGLREMADWLEATPGAVVRAHGNEFLYSINEGSEETDRAELLRLAEIFGEAADLDAAHPGVRKSFRGGVGVRAYYIPTTKPADETTRAGDPDLAPEVPAVATTQPGDSFTPAGEEVADPTGASGSATAPELVWMAVMRRGADFHKLDGDRTTCGRSTVTGGTDGREFLTVRLGAKPCPRCYPGEAAK